MRMFWRVRLPWLALLAVVIASGIASRAFPVGHPLFDKYLGDALYAAMVYILLHLTGRIRRVALWAAVVMTALECFQLTGIPAALVHSGHVPLRLIARLLGTHFHWLDLAAYAADILPLACFHRPGPPERTSRGRLT
ncbi:MAG: DUF2809 domain-containing protein [Bryobacterales bacterium]|nr:DUF2809 domain-containing protein [Bryobacterales bacterium]